MADESSTNTQPEDPAEKDKLVRRTIGLHPGVTEFLEAEARARGNDFSAMLRHALFEWAKSQGYHPSRGLHDRFGYVDMEAFKAHVRKAGIQVEGEPQ